MVILKVIVDFTLKMSKLRILKYKYVNLLKIKTNQILKVVIGDLGDLVDQIRVVLEKDHIMSTLSKRAV